MSLYKATLYILVSNNNYILSTESIGLSDKKIFRPVQTMVVRKNSNGTVCEILSGIAFPMLKFFDNEEAYVLTKENRLLYAAIDKKLSKKEIINLQRNLLQKELIEQTVESINDLLAFEKQKLEKNKMKTKIKNR